MTDAESAEEFFADVLTNAASQRNKNTEMPKDSNEYDAGKFRLPRELGAFAMIDALAEIAMPLLAASLMVALFAGFIKGAVGFGVPMIVISGIGSFMPAEVAVAALIIPTLITNFVQAFRNGLTNAWSSFLKFWRYNLVLFVMILLSAQLVTVFPEKPLLLVLGGPLVVFTLIQLAGWQPKIRKEFERVTELSVAIIAGFFGGLAGVWGPPTILYLNALEIPKVEHIRIQGIMYLMGSAMLLIAHLGSGVLNEKTIPYSVILVAPVLAGQFVGMRMQNRFNQQLFRRATLFVLMIAGFNLLRRGLIG